jgi:dienelactone hydrolase
MRSAVLLAGLLTLAGPPIGEARAADAARTPAPVVSPEAVPVAAPTKPDCAHPIVQHVVELQASDGRRVPGILMHPAAGLDAGSPGIVLLHGGPFGHPIRTQSAARFAAEGLACRGYATLSILSRHAGGYYSTPVAEGTRDLAAAVDWLSGFGIHDVVFAGHSFGSVRMSLYLAETADPRVKALVHYAPTRGSREYLPLTFAPGGYDAQVQRLRAMVAEGRGDEPTYVEFNYPPPAPRGARFGYVMTAANWLDWWGPESVAQNVELMPKIRVPMLMITGGADMFVTPDYQQRLAKAATASPRVDTRVYEGAGHELYGAERRVVDDTASWLESLGLGVRPRVRTQLVDVEVASGRTAYGPLYQAGVLYEPEDAAKSHGPAVLLTYDRREDVLTGRYEGLALRLAQRGYRVLVPQDRSYALNADRIDATATDEDFATWVPWLASRAGAPVVLAGPGWGAERIAGFVARRGKAGVAGLVLLEPLPDGEAWARQTLGDPAYEAAVRQAREAQAAGMGARTLVAAKNAQGEYVVRHLADAFLAQYGPDRTPLPELVRRAGVPTFDTPTAELASLAEPLDRWLRSLPKREAQPRVSRR